MTENEVKDKILNKIADLVDKSNCVELSYLASTLTTVEKIGKPDAMAEVYKSTMESLAKVREMTLDKTTEAENG